MLWQDPGMGLQQEGVCAMRPFQPSCITKGIPCEDDAEEGMVAAAQDMVVILGRRGFTGQG